MSVSEKPGRGEGLARSACALPFVSVVEDEGVLGGGISGVESPVVGDGEGAVFGGGGGCCCRSCSKIEGSKPSSSSLLISNHCH